MANSQNSDESNRPDLADLRKSASESLWRCARTGFWRLYEEAPRVWNDPREARYYREEKRLVQEAADGVKFGAFMGVLILVTFRVGGSKWFTRWRQRNNINFSAHAMETSESATLTPAAPRTSYKTYSEQQAEKVEAAYLEARNWTTDVILSIMCGLSSALLLTDTQKIGQDLVSAPLLPGKSVIYSDVCPAMTSAYEAVDPEVWKDLTEKERTLLMFHNFVQNCRIRKEFLTMNAQTEESVVEGFIQDKTHDVVPKPGLDGFKKLT